MSDTLFPCHICGEDKQWNDFKYVLYFSYKKKRVQWCRECQKMFIDKKKKEERLKEEQNRKINFVVSF